MATILRSPGVALMWGLLGFVAGYDAPRAAARHGPPSLVVRRRQLAIGVPAALLLRRGPAFGACLPSDLADECIGVYKERATDITREDARAAGLRWTERPTFSKLADAAAALRRERAVVVGWRRASDLKGVGTSILRVRPVVEAAAETVAAAGIPRRDEGTRELWSRAAEVSLFAFDAADVAVGFAIREQGTRDLVARNVAAYDALETAVGEYLTLLRFLDAILPEGEKKKEPKAAKKKRPA